MQRLLAIVFVMLCASQSALAHTSGASYVNLTAQSPTQLRLQLDLDLRDLTLLLPLDANRDGELTWGELRSAQSAIESLALRKISIAAAGVPCEPSGRDALAIAEHGDGPFTRIDLTLTCKNVSALQIDYSTWFAFDPGHRALLSYTDSDGANSRSILSQTSPQWRPEESTWDRTRRFFAEGVAHLIAGYDHLAFLAVLLLSLVRRGKNESPPSLTALLRGAALVVTSFTLAHSITLGLAATGWVTLPSQPVEIIIAASVVLAALLNLRAGSAHHGWKLAFAFGLVHGLGFAGALAELGEQIDLVALAAFNVGIETAQLALAALAVPVLWWLFQTRRGADIGIPVASVAVACVAASWLLDRI